MKIRIVFADIFGVAEALTDATRESLKGKTFSDADEATDIYWARYNVLANTCSAWVEHDTYLTIEIDTATNTARVVPVSEIEP